MVRVLLLRQREQQQPQPLLRTICPSRHGITAQAIFKPPDMADPGRWFRGAGIFASRIAESFSHLQGLNEFIIFVLREAVCAHIVFLFVLPFRRTGAACIDFRFFTEPGYLHHFGAGIFFCRERQYEFHIRPYNPDGKKNFAAGPFGFSYCEGRQSHRQ